MHIPACNRAKVITPESITSFSCLKSRHALVVTENTLAWARCTCAPTGLGVLEIPFPEFGEFVTDFDSSIYSRTNRAMGVGDSFYISGIDFVGPDSFVQCPHAIAAKNRREITANAKAKVQVSDDIFAQVLTIVVVSGEVTVLGD
jgi:hypothetical protein